MHTLMAEQEIGKVTHYFDKAGVAVVKLSGDIATGDTLKFRKGETEFTDVVESMQVNHEPVISAKAGDEVAIKISQQAREGATLYKMD